MTKASRHFDIDAGVVFRLGEELITDSVQALLELVKNSYDANATWVKISIETGGKNSLGRRYASSIGVIKVEDDGDGMSEESIEGGWLTIGHSPKSAAKKAGKVTRLGRTPIGDKGLGRLGVQKLAKNVEILTRPWGKSVEHYVAFSWADFRPASQLSKVPLVYESSPTDHVPGTKLVLSDLVDAESWGDDQYLEDLQRNLSGMISPFAEARDFVVYLQVDGRQLELAEVSQRLRDAALLRYRFEFDGSTLRISGMARLDYLQPSKETDQSLLRSLYRADKGDALFGFLSKRARRRRLSSIIRSEQPGWFVEFSSERKLEDLDKVRLVDKRPANPGPFRGEVDSVSLDSSDGTIHVLDRQSDYRKLVRDLAGVRVYRDGFGIRVDDDWLGLGKQWTRGSSYYGLKPGNVLGYVSLSARDNQSLIETTSREGFQATPHYENFYALLKELVRFSSEAQEFLRRGVLSYLNEHRDQAADVQPEDTPYDVSQRLETVAATLATERARLKQRSEELRNTTGKAANALKDARASLVNRRSTEKSSTEALARLDQALADLEAIKSTSERHLRDVGAALERASELRGLREALDQRWESLQEEVSAAYESISLGLTAEALSHEIHNIADGLARRSTAILRRINKGGLRTSAVVTYVEHVRSSVAAMRKQLAHLTPSLRYLRERRERIDIRELLEELREFYSPRLEAKSIYLDVRSENEASFAVKMNKGKLSQIFDNLVLNSEYWLSEALRTDRVDEGRMSIIVEPPFVTVLDNGRGVDPSVEHTLFEPFVTTKRAGEGRGLGLFVVQQLLDSESCGARLLPTRNAEGRRYRFELDFTGALCD